MLKPRIDPDELDLEALKATVESPGFRRIQERWAAMYAAELAQMANVASWDNARFKQGMLGGITAATDVPKILIDELRARNRKKAAA